MTAQITILLVEDDQRLAALIKAFLQQQGMTVKVEGRGDYACQRILQQSPSLVILDLMLPHMDGIEVCRQVRPHYRGPILMLTALGEQEDQIKGLEMGADDYVQKPVEPRVLLARIRALLRRFSSIPQTDDGTSVRRIGKLQISSMSREAQLDGEPLNLTSNEFELLWLLAGHAGVILSRDTILERLRGIGYDGQDRSVDIRISRLRKKLHDNPAQPFRIKTVRGQGYLFVKEAWD